MTGEGAAAEFLLNLILLACLVLAGGGLIAMVLRSAGIGDKARRR